jgi:organic hydroperoxide reductase OsmC/OhrA
MHPYPHTYVASAAGQSAGLIAVTASQLPEIETAPPPEFDGPGKVWSPETLLCAALADCFILTFRAVSRAARMEWTRLECRVEGVLERVDRQSQFTRFTTFATLTIPANTDLAKAHEILERAESGCLIANSLRAARSLEVHVLVADPHTGHHTVEPAAA